MAPGAQDKAKRRKKKAPRTEVVLSDSESDAEVEVSQPTPPTIPAFSEALPNSTSPPSKKVKASSSILSSEPKTRDSEAKTAFSAYYMEHVVKEFADDLDRIRAADDFGDASLPMLIGALQSGVGAFSEEDMRRVVGGLNENTG